MWRSSFDRTAPPLGAPGWQLQNKGPGFTRRRRTVQRVASSRRMAVAPCARVALVALAIAGLAIPHAWAAPGDKLYVQKNGVNVREGPGTDHAVILKLNRGHELVEFARQAGWVNVGVARTGGKDGWIHASLVGPLFSGGATAAPKDPRFDAFVRDVGKLNAKAASIAGFAFFSKIENLGDGIVQLTAHRQWLAGPRADREGNLTTLFNLWSAHEGSGLPIAVYIVDSRGNVVMKKARR